MSVEDLIDELIEREGGYVCHPADRGGPTRFGITEAVARAHGYGGAMAALPRDEAAAIYRRLYWLRPRFDQVAERTPRVAAELFDTGANMGPAVAATFLQRALTALNRGGKDFPDLVPDGRVGPSTIAALDAFRKRRFLHDLCDPREFLTGLFSTRSSRPFPSFSTRSFPTRWPATRPSWSC